MHVSLHRFKVKNSLGQMGWYNENEVELADPRPPPVQEAVPRPPHTLPRDEVCARLLKQWAEIQTLVKFFSSVFLFLRSCALLSGCCPSPTCMLLLLFLTSVVYAMLTDVLFVS